MNRTLPRRSLSAALAGTLLLSGCAPERVQPRTGPFEDSEVQALASELETGDAVTVWLSDGTRKHGELTCIDTELLCFGRDWIPWSDVERIEQRDAGGHPALAAAFVVGMGLLILAAVTVKSALR